MKEWKNKYCAVCKKKILHKKKAVVHSFGPVTFFDEDDHQEIVKEDRKELWCEKCHKKYMKQQREF